MPDFTRKLSPEEWNELIQNYRSSGLTAVQWCEAHGFKVNQLRWQMTKRQKLNQDDRTIKWEISLLHVKALIFLTNQCFRNFFYGFSRSLFHMVHHFLHLWFRFNDHSSFSIVLNVCYACYG